jgi:hypothetical protein
MVVGAENPGQDGGGKRVGRKGEEGAELGHAIAEGAADKVSI